MEYVEQFVNTVFDTLISTLKVLSRPKTKQLVISLVIAAGMFIVDGVLMLLGLPTFENPLVYLVAVVFISILLIISRSTVGGYISMLQNIKFKKKENEINDDE